VITPARYTGPGHTTGPPGTGAGPVPASLSVPGRYWLTVSARRGSFQPGRGKWQV
jgi:hypothetical protein